MSGDASTPAPAPEGTRLTGDDVARLRRQGASGPRRVAGALVLILLGVMLVRVLLGGYTVTLPDFVTILRGESVPGAAGARFIVMEDKLPRAVLGALAGLALGCSGAVFQLLLRNPLASPDVIGVSASASFGAIIALAFFGASGLGLSVGALAGAGLAAAVIFGLSVGGPGQAVGNRFVLIGLGISVLAISLTHYILQRISVYQASDAAIWLTGSLGSANWQRIGMLTAVLLVLMPLLALTHRNLHMMAVGEDLAQGLGVPAGPTRWLCIGLAVALAAFTVAATGPVAFVAFASGPIMRKLTGGRHHLTGSALVGAVIVVAADFAAAELIPGGPLPVGVVTGVVGAPVLLALIASAQKERA